MRSCQQVDIEKLRADTPGTANRIHLNNAGASLMPNPVIDALKDHIDLEAQIGGYEAYHQQIDSIEQFYESTSRLLSCKPKEIAFIETATRAWDMAFYSIPFQRGDRILTSVAEYGSNYIAYLQLQRSKGIEIDVIPNDECGQVSISDLENMIDERVKLISITHVPTNGGLVNPAEQIGKIARQANVLYLLDACQSVGQLSVDVEKIGCDMLSATGRKYLRGPRGTAFLFVRENMIEHLEPVLLDLHAAEWTETNDYLVRADARRFENWEQNYAGKIGLKVAIDYLLSLGIDWVETRVLELAERFRDRLSEIKQVEVVDIGEKRSGIVSFVFDGIESEDIVKHLAKHDINVSHSTPFGTRLDMEDRKIDHMVRASVHYFNTEDEIERVCDVLSSLS